MIRRRQSIRRTYEAAFRRIDGLRFLGSSDGYVDDDNCWLSCIVLDPHYFRVGPPEVIRSLENMGIEARHLWKPMHLQPVFSQNRVFDTGVGARMFDNGLALPSGSGLNDEEVAHVIAPVRTLLT